MTDSGRVIVIGAGVTGLTVAYELMERGVSVVVLEAGDRVGGVIRTERRDGVLLEQGPYSVMARSQQFKELIAKLSLEPIQAVADASKKRYVLYGNQLRLVPTSPKGLISSTLLSPWGKMRAAAGFVCSQPRRSDSDETTEQVVRRRFGTEVVDRLVSPASVGIFAADADELSFDACFPRLARADRTHRSVIAAMKSLRTNTTPGNQSRQKPMMLTFETGLSSFVNAMASRIGAQLMLGERVAGLSQTDQGIYRVDTDADSYESQSVVIATPAHTTAQLLAPVAPEAAKALSDIRCASLGVVHLAFQREDVEHALDGFGYLVAKQERGAEPVLGVLWPSSVFPQHAPASAVVLRVMVGGSRWPRVLEMRDDELISRALDAVGSILGVRGKPWLTSVARWPSSIPVYTPGHLACVQRVEQAMEAVPRVWAAGNWSGGLGVNDRVREASVLASSIADKVKMEARK